MTPVKSTQKSNGTPPEVAPSEGVQVSIADLLMKIGSLTVQLDIANNQIAQLQQRA